MNKILEQEKKSLRQLATSWNNLDIRFIEQELASNFVYESQWVLTRIEGKKKFLLYLRSKFNAIKSAMQSEAMTVTAEMAIHPSIQNRPCVILTQICKEGTRQVSVIAKIRETKIERIDVCFIPDPRTAKLSGEFPK